MSLIAECSPVKRRSKGLLTREKILNATIDVLALVGIKGTTHRAIANHANIQLSLTTYYFSDINSLIFQAFELNSERLLHAMHNMYEHTFTALSAINKTQLRRVAIKNQLCEQLSQLISGSLFHQIKTHTNALIVEQLMLTTTQATVELMQLKKSHEQSRIQPLTKLCAHFNNADPEIDALMMQTIFSQLQYQHVALPVDIHHQTKIELSVNKILAWVMGIK